MHQKTTKSHGLVVTFLDLETTSKNPNTTEILTAYLRTRRVYDWSIIDSISLTFKPQNYLEDSFEIHNISYKEANSFDDKWASFRNLLAYINKYTNTDAYNGGILCCHANHNVFGAYGYFDVQVIRQVAFTNTNINGSKQYYWLINKKIDVVSTHTITKHFLHLENYKLETIAKYFRIQYVPHTADGDVFACEEIFRKLVPNDISRKDLLSIGCYKTKMEELL